MKSNLLLSLLLTIYCIPNAAISQIVLEATYPTINLQRINLQVSGEKWYYSDDDRRQIFFFNADHTPWKTINYPFEINKKVVLATVNIPISQTTFNVDNLMELIWLFKDTMTQRERIKILNERNDSVFIFPEGRNSLTINELVNSPTKIFVENRDNYSSYKTTIYGLPNMIFEKTYTNASNMHRQRFGHAGERYYFKNVPQKRIEICNTNHICRSIPIPVPPNGGSTTDNDPVFFADDKIFDADTLVEFAFSYDLGSNYGLAKIVNENNREILPINSLSSFVLDQQVGVADKIFLNYTRDNNTVNTQYKVIGLPYPTIEEHTYWSPIQRIVLKQFGAKFISFEYNRIQLLNTNHTVWKSINPIYNSGYSSTVYQNDVLPFVSDSIVNRDSLLEIIWTEWKQTSPRTSHYQLRITTENGINLATIPNARSFSVNKTANLPMKLVTKMWDSTRYNETKVWRFTSRTATQDPSVLTALNAQISPNPFTSTFTITHDVDKPLNIRLFNTVGILVFSEIINSSNSEIKPPNNLPQGVYLLEITDGEKRIIKRLTKIN